VDTTESRSSGQRSDEQAAYFGVTRAQAIELGRQAKIFTVNALAQPFTIYTRWRSVFGPRYYAIVITAGGRDLNELLVSSGLARIYGTRTLTARRSGLPRISHASARSGKRGQGCEARRVGYGVAVTYWQIILENLRNAGWNCGSMTTTDGKGRPIWVVAAERRDAGPFIGQADEKLTAFLELQAAIHRRFELRWKVRRGSMFC
jgi:hypothetical protein